MFKNVLTGNTEYAPFYELDKSVEGRIFAIADIHGCLKTFNALLAQIKLSKQDYLFILGDMVNKGPNSLGVVDKVLELLFDGFNVFPPKRKP